MLDCWRCAAWLGMVRSLANGKPAAVSATAAQSVHVAYKGVHPGWLVSCCRWPIFTHVLDDAVYSVLQVLQFQPMRLLEGAPLLQRSNICGKS